MIFRHFLLILQQELLFTLIYYFNLLLNRSECPNAILSQHKLENKSWSLQWIGHNQSNFGQYQRKDDSR